MIYIIFQVKTIVTNNTHVPNNNCFLFIPLIYFYYKTISFTALKCTYKKNSKLAAL